MKHRRFFAALALSIAAAAAFSQEEVIEAQERTDAHQEQELQEPEFSPTFRNYALAYLGTQLDNILISFYNRTIVTHDYADIDLNTMWNNITHPWTWDDDEFNINQIGHPYQGSLYHQSARANGLNFYESLAATAFGSLTWELLMENETPSYNDLIVTSVQGALFGEALHRVYLDTTGKIPVLPAIIAPQSALTHFVSGSPCPDSTRSHLSMVSFGAGGGIYNSYSERNASGNRIMHTMYPEMNLNAAISYGDVYEEPTFTPLESFSLDVIGALNFPPSYTVLLNGDGVLLSLIPDFKNPTALTLDLVYQYYDVMRDLNFSNNALGATIRQKIDLKHDSTLEWKEQLQYAFLAGYDNAYLLEKQARTDLFGREQRLYDLGIGIANCAGVSFKNPTLGNLRIETHAGIYKTIPQSVQTSGSDGFSAVEYISAEYEHRLYKNLYFSLSSLFYFRQAFYTDLEDYRQFTNSTSAFIKYYLI